MQGVRISSRFGGGFAADKAWAPTPDPEHAAPPGVDRFAAKEILLQPLEGEVAKKGRKRARRAPQRRRKKLRCRPPPRSPPRASKGLSTSLSLFDALSAIKKKKKKFLPSRTPTAADKLRIRSRLPSIPEPKGPKEGCPFVPFAPLRADSAGNFSCRKLRLRLSRADGRDPDRQAQGAAAPCGAGGGRGGRRGHSVDPGRLARRLEALTACRG